MPDAPAQLFFDYVDPASLLVERRLAEVESALGVVVRRRPFELRPPPAPLLDPEDPAWLKYWTDMAEAARGDGLELAAAPSLVPWTRKAHELAHHARGHDLFEPVHRSLFHAFLVEGRDIGRVDVLAEMGRTHGLDWTDTRATLDVDKHAGAVEEGRAAAERLGIRGVPTLLAGARSLEGLHPPDSIAAFLEDR
ncbi:MAG: DsbA family protein [Gemmatimonadetes bacterium]|nr:DsbA family protein [Gemmatimonadota bacterium]